ncbi:MAG: class I SAM-dependent methyltransferase [Pseudomonadota bacterium]
MTGKTSIEDAYGVEGGEALTRLYSDWAETYDESFAAAHGYIVPDHLARILTETAGSDDGLFPVLDIGAGTGLVGAALVAAGVEGATDALDLSAKMLEVAGAKGLYRNRICADLTETLPVADRSYGGFVSAGTFTHGHVGPNCLPELLRIAKPGALFCLSINAQVFDEAGFGSAFADLVAVGEITPLNFHRIAFYSPEATHDHAQDTGLVAVFRRV